MRYSLIITFLFLVLFRINAQIEIDTKPDDRNDPPFGLTNCITLIGFEFPETGIGNDLHDILQTGRPFGAQEGFGAYILNKSVACQSPGNLVVRFAKTGHCSWTQSYQSIRSYSVSVLFNGEEVGTVALNGIGSEEIIVPISNLPLDQITNTPSLATLELKLERVMTNMFGAYIVISHNFFLADITIVANGDELFFMHENPDGYVSTRICNRVALNDVDDILQNCSSTESITISHQLRDFHSTNSSSSFEASYEVNASVGGGGTTEGNINYNGNLQGSAGQSVSFEDEEILSNATIMNQVVVLPPRSEEGCSFMGVELIGKRVYLQVNTVSCDNLDAGEISNDQVIYTAIQPTVCTSPNEVPEDCLPAVIDFDISFNRGRSIASLFDPEDNCTVSIIAFQEPVPEYLQTILWDGPGDFEAVGNSIENAPIGIYRVTVYDECGGETEFIIDACEGGTIVSAWAFDEDANELCRTASCSGGEGCEGTTAQECITPAFGAWEYDAATREACRQIICPDGDACDTDIQCVDVQFGSWDYADDGVNTNCFRDVLVFGEVIGQEEQPSIVTYEYNEILDQCFRYTRCADPMFPIPTLVNTETESPVYEDWQFDAFTEICVRTVNCFDLSDSDVWTDPTVDFENPADPPWDNTNSTPQYSWDYTEHWGCTGYVFCDPFEAASHPFNTDWELDQSEGTPVVNSVGYDEQFGVIRCVLDVDCSYNGIQYNTIPAFPPLLSEAIDAVNATFIGSPQFDGFCQYEYQCGLEAPYLLNQNFVGEIIGTDENGNDLCVAYCEGFKSTTSQPAVLCSSISGFTEGANQLVDVENPSHYQFKWQEEHRNSRYVESDLSNTQISPNPFNQQIVLENIPALSQEVKIMLLDVNGHAVLNQSHRNVQSVNLNTIELPAGMYLLMVLGENEEVLFERRLVKIK